MPFVLPVSQLVVGSGSVGKNIGLRLRHRFKCSGIGRNPELVEAENAGA